jgi:bilirubin oxidase
MLFRARGLLILAATFIVIIPPVSAQESMPGMMMPMMGRDTTTAPALPRGEMFQPIAKLENKSRQHNLFKADVIAAPAEVEFVAGKKTTVWAYNNSLPGSLIEVYEGDTVEITFINKLPQPSTIHWHGLPIPPEQDGNPMDPVLPGQSHTYRFTMPEGSAGTYWYHPHPHEYTAEQVYRGLAAPFIVRAKNDPLKDIPERNLMISDLKLTREGAIAGNDAMDWMNGREGQYVLVNGQFQPVINLQGTERWRIWNASSARYLNLSLSGHKFTLVGTDGGLLEKPVRDLQQLLLSPAERVEIIVDTLGQKGSVNLQLEPYNRGKMGHVAVEKTTKIATVNMLAGNSISIPDSLRKIDDLGATKSIKKIIFTEIMSMANGQHSMQFLINGKSFDMARIDFMSRTHEVELWEISNQSDMDHPFHVHGTQFQVAETERNNVRTVAPFRAWKDTVNVRAGETVRIKIRQDFPGLRMLHCHILEHEVQGMMAIQQVK